MGRDIFEIVASVIICLGLLVANPIVTNDIPSLTQNRMKNNALLRIVVALAVSYSITHSFRDSLIALFIFLILKRYLKTAYSQRSRRSS
jgi:hypothetical protein